mmetsp:Transcript_54763/g.168751  ORF Transcript_54763/g.168751 Transcript_54763/m.168751 type:complete len:493 (+) Transcript_54763:276-1754(+)
MATSSSFCRTAASVTTAAPSTCVTMSPMLSPATAAGPPFHSESTVSCFSVPPPWACSSSDMPRNGRSAAVPSGTGAGSSSVSSPAADGVSSRSPTSDGAEAESASAAAASSSWRRLAGITGLPGWSLAVAARLAGASPSWVAASCAWNTAVGPEASSGPESARASLVAAAGAFVVTVAAAAGTATTGAISSAAPVGSAAAARALARRGSSAATPGKLVCPRRTVQPSASICRSKPMNSKTPRAGSLWRITVALPAVPTRPLRTHTKTLPAGKAGASSLSTSSCRTQKRSVRSFTPPCESSTSKRSRVVGSRTMCMTRWRPLAASTLPGYVPDGRESAAGTEAAMSAACSASRSGTCAPCMSASRCIARFVRSRRRLECCIDALRTAANDSTTAPVARERATMVAIMAVSAGSGSHSRAMPATTPGHRSMATGAASSGATPSRHSRVDTKRSSLLPATRRRLAFQRSAPDGDERESAPSVGTVPLMSAPSSVT